MASLRGRMSDLGITTRRNLNRRRRTARLWWRALRSADWRPALQTPGSNRFIGGLTGRTGTSWLHRLVGGALQGRSAAIGEHGAFVLGQLRSAAYELYQVTPGSPAQRLAYLDYFGSFVLREAYDRKRMYGSGAHGLRQWLPRRCIREALEMLETESLAAGSLDECRRCFGRFYSRLLNVAAVLEAGRVEWVSKEPPYGRHADDLYALIPDCRLVVMVRDGRDTALSMARRGWHRGDVRSCMDRWRIFSEMTLASLARLPDENVLRIHYEDLLEDVRGSLLRALRFFGYEEAEVVLDPRALEPPLEDNRGKWREALDRESKAYFERTCGELSARLGYE